MDFGAVQLKEMHLSALDEMGDDGAVSPPNTMKRGDGGVKRTSRKKTIVIARSFKVTILIVCWEYFFCWGMFFFQVHLLFPSAPDTLLEGV